MGETSTTMKLLFIMAQTLHQKIGYLLFTMGQVLHQQRSSLLQWHKLCINKEVEFYYVTNFASTKKLLFNMEQSLQRQRSSFLLWDKLHPQRSSFLLWDKRSVPQSSCYHRSGFGSRHEVCSCGQDLCNGAGDVTMAAILPSLLAVVAAKMAA